MRRSNVGGVVMLVSMVAAVAVAGPTGCQRPRFRQPSDHEPFVSQPIGERPGAAVRDPVRK